MLPVYSGCFGKGESLHQYRKDATNEMEEHFETSLSSPHFIPATRHQIIRMQSIIQGSSFILGGLLSSFIDILYNGMRPSAKSTTDVIMGRKGRNRRRWQTESFSSDDDSNNGRDSRNNGMQAGRFQRRSYAVRARVNSPTNHQFPRRNTSQQHDQPFQNRIHPHRSQTNNAHIPRSSMHNELLIKSQRFKQQLLQSINQTLKQIQQWYPDGDSSEDQMDWQPEAEIILPQLVKRDINTTSSGDPGLKTQKDSSYMERVSVVKAHMNLVQPLGPRVMSRVSLGSDFGSAQDQRMERDMNSGDLLSFPRSCKYAVPTALC